MCKRCEEAMKALVIDRRMEDIQSQFEELIDLMNGSFGNFLLAPVLGGRDGKLMFIHLTELASQVYLHDIIQGLETKVLDLELQLVERDIDADPPEVKFDA